MTDRTNKDRGKPASIDRASGEVRGSGAGAGGGNEGEDYDSASAGASGDEPEGAARPINRAERPPEDKYQETYG